MENHKEEPVITYVYDINLDHLRKMSVEELKKYPRTSLEYLLSIFVKKDRSLYEGDEMMQDILKQLDEASKEENESIYYE